MSTTVYPAVTPQEELLQVQLASKNELDWLVNNIQEEISSSIAGGLDGCLQRLCEKDNSYKLPLSSGRSECLKGIATRSGSQIINLDITLRLHSLNKGQDVRIKLKPETEYPLVQVIDTVNLVLSAQELLSQINYNNPVVVVSDLTECLRLIRTAISNFKSPKASQYFPLKPTDTHKFSVTANNEVDCPIIDFYIHDSTLAADVRVIAGSEAKVNSLSTLLLGRKQISDNAMVYEYEGKQVVELERVRVEAQDPSLISVTAKLVALESHIAIVKRKLEIGMAAANP